MRRANGPADRGHVMIVDWANVVDLQCDECLSQAGQPHELDFDAGRSIHVYYRAQVPAAQVEVRNVTNEDDRI